MNAALHAVHDSPLFGRANRPGYRYADDLVYLAPSLTEGREVFGRAKELIAKAGLTFKGGNAHHEVDLRTGDEIPILGLKVRKEGDAITSHTDPTAWDRLAEHLREAHAREAPQATARAVVDGWIASQAPALETWRTADFRRTADTCLGHGIDGVTPDTVRGMGMAARVRWGKIRTDAFKANGGVQSTITT